MATSPGRGIIDYRFLCTPRLEAVKNTQLMTRAPEKLPCRVGFADREDGEHGARSARDQDEEYAPLDTHLI
ncbi:MAG: hypothetical protein BWY85_01818 [Firmicutes bacterium ADurb.Bin506]|nr:MAG: hypothetical protein BWY85_01818 [Firmicutes bacterium ADurb.Bin506]